MESLPYWKLSPDFDFFTAMPNSSGRETLVARTQDAKLVIAYTPYGDTLELQRSKLATIYTAEWFDPRTGKSFSFSPAKRKGNLVFVPPFGASRGNDWVLVLKAE